MIRRNPDHNVPGITHYSMTAYRKGAEPLGDQDTATQLAKSAVVYATQSEEQTRALQLVYKNGNIFKARMK